MILYGFQSDPRQFSTRCCVGRQQFDGVKNHWIQHLLVTAGDCPDLVCYCRNFTMPTVGEFLLLGLLPDEFAGYRMGHTLDDETTIERQKDHLKLLGIFLLKVGNNFRACFDNVTDKV